MKENKITQFLRESNAIEDVFDEDSLQQAQYAWDYLSKQEILTVGVILKTHKILMLHQHLQPDEKGYFRKRRIWIGGREGLDFKKIKKEMENWETDVFLDPGDWKRCHIRYEQIHPFIDGNGRSGRLFLLWQRLKRGLPILIIKSKDKYKYYSWFS